MKLIQHMESHLGPIVDGWTPDLSDSPGMFQVARFAGGSLKGVETYATVGLSSHELKSRRSGKVMHLELLMSVHATSAGDRIAALVDQIGRELISAGAPVLRGDVVGPRGVIAQGSAMEAFYCAPPVYFDDQFAAVDLTPERRAVMVLLIPIGTEEVDFVQKNGWQSFENILVREDPDLLDIYRSPVGLG